MRFLYHQKAKSEKSKEKLNNESAEFLLADIKIKKAQKIIVIVI